MRKHMMLVYLALGMGACDGDVNIGEDGNVNASCTDDCGDVNTDCTDDCDDDVPTGEGQVTTWIYHPEGYEIPAAVSFYSTATNISELYESGETAKLPAGIDYKRTYGNPAFGTTSDGLPIIFDDVDGSTWVRPTDGFFLEDKADVEYEAVVNPYFYGDDVECDIYWDGEFLETRSEDELVETEAGYKLKFPENMGNGNWFEFIDGDVTWVGDKPDDGMTLLDFQYSTDEVSFTYESSTGEKNFICRF